MKCRRSPAIASLFASATMLVALCGARAESFGREVAAGAGACPVTLTPAKVDVGAAGATALVVNVTVTAGCPDDARSLSAFVVVTAGRTGVGSGSLSFDVVPNAGDARRGTILIGGTRFFVDQAKPAAPRKTAFDLDLDGDGDGKADVAIYRPSNGTWYVRGTATGFTSVQFGFGADVPIPSVLRR